MKRSLIIFFIVIATFLLFLAGCYPKQSLTVQDSSGSKVSLKKPAERIVSTVPSNTEILYALGLRDRVIGLTKYCGKTCDTEGKVIIGGWVDPDYEKIRGLEPDLIFAFGGMQKRHLDEFLKIAPTYCFEPRTVEETLQAILDIGRLTGCEEKSRQIVKAQREALGRVRDRLSSLAPEERLEVARVFGADTNVMTLGRRSFLTDVIRLAGGVNVFGDVDDDYFSVPFERLASLDPDILIVHGEKEEETKKKALFKESPEFSRLKAVKNNKVFVYSCDYICHPNADIANTVEMIAEGLYPVYGQKNYPKRIISLGPSITESLYLLGAQDNIVGVTSYCIRPAGAKEKEKVGTVIDVNVEKAASLKPDLVIATPFTDPKTVEKLKNLGMNVMTFLHPENFSEICGQFMKLAELAGRDKEGAQIIEAAKDRVKYIKDRVKGLPRPKVFIQLGTKPLVAAAKGFFVNDFIELAGGINIAKDAKRGLYSREEVLRKNPDVIIIVTMGIAGEKEKDIWTKYKTLKAATSGRIYVIDSYKLCSPTPLSFAEILEEIARILHPNMKGEAV